MRSKLLSVITLAASLAGATVAYGQATQVPAPGGNLPPVATPAPGPNPGPGPSPTGGTARAPSSARGH